MRPPLWPHGSRRALEERAPHHEGDKSGASSAAARQRVPCSRCNEIFLCTQCKPTSQISFGDLSVLRSVPTERGVSRSSQNAGRNAVDARASAARKILIANRNDPWP